LPRSYYTEPIEPASNIFFFMRSLVDVSITLFGIAIFRSVFLACNVKREA
jgi:hypothetical protein